MLGSCWHLRVILCLRRLAGQLEGGQAAPPLVLGQGMQSCAACRCWQSQRPPSNASLGRRPTRPPKVGGSRHLQPAPAGAEEEGTLDVAVLEEHTEPARPELSTYMVDDLRGQEPPSGAPRPHPARPACRQAHLAPCCAAQGKDGKGTSGGGSKHAASGQRPFFDNMALHLGTHDAPEQNDEVMAAKPPRGLNLDSAEVGHFWAGRRVYCCTRYKAHTSRLAKWTGHRSGSSATRTGCSH